MRRLFMIKKCGSLTSLPSCSASKTQECNGANKVNVKPAANLDHFLELPRESAISRGNDEHLGEIGREVEGS